MDTHARLWSIMHGSLVAEARATGFAYASWERVEPKWRGAYRWVLDRMRARSIDGVDGRVSTPPIWAWHSCGGWQSPPTTEDVEALLPLAPEIRSGLVMVSLRMATSRFLLSHYGGWNALLDGVEDGHSPDTFGDGVLIPHEHEPSASRETLQATFVRLERGDIVSVAPFAKQ